MFAVIPKSNNRPEQIMNRNTTYGLFGVTFALVAAGLLGTNVLTAQPSDIVAQDTSSSAGMNMIGHVTTIVTDANGDIKAYRQTDNFVVNNGKDCVTKAMFGGASTGGRSAGTATAGIFCVGAVTHPFNVIAVGNGTGAVSPATTDFRLAKEAGGGATGLARQQGAITYTNATGSASSTVLIQATFGPLSGQRAAGTQVTESGLFNDTADNSTTGGMFAHQGISSIALNNGDSLTIKWTINTG